MHFELVVICGLKTGKRHIFLTIKISSSVVLDVLRGENIKLSTLAQEVQIFNFYLTKRKLGRTVSKTDKISE